jgi:hypothetical protein
MSDWWSSVGDKNGTWPWPSFSSWMRRDDVTRDFEFGRRVDMSLGESHGHYKSNSTTPVVDIITL